MDLCPDVQQACSAGILPAGPPASSRPGEVEDRQSCLSGGRGVEGAIT